MEKMKIEKKDVLHYLTVGGILCGIGAVSALLISLSNLATSDTIKLNRYNAEQKALKSIYNYDNINFGEKTKINNKSYDLLQYYWNPVIDLEGAEKAAEETVTPGWIFQAHGADESNYGKITILIEIKFDQSIGRLELIENTESYATVVKNEYLDKVNSGNRDYDDVKCGATKGATLIKNMADEAKDYCAKVLNWEKEAK